MTLALDRSVAPLVGFLVCEMSIGSFNHQSSGGSVVPASGTFQEKAGTCSESSRCLEKVSSCSSVLYSFGNSMPRFCGSCSSCSLSEFATLLQEWPLPIMKKVYRQLSAEVQPNLLLRELQLSCTHAGGWWEKSLTFQYSMAASSMVSPLMM